MTELLNGVSEFFALGVVLVFPFLPFFHYYCFLHEYWPSVVTSDFSFKEIEVSVGNV